MHIGFVWVISAIQFIIRQSVADIPEDVRIQKERKLFFESKLIKRLRDEDVARLTQEDPSVTREWLLESCRQKCV